MVPLLILTVSLLSRFLPTLRWSFLISDIRRCKCL
ncbi:hypothetical protein EVA_01745 [gut metagenome]|uniref:Uncharacterized protein n=1 Tax=gut metagenome TaxID=749906 RepID=J9GQP7_9ZZZZ